jgi:hypothetical protein
MLLADQEGKARCGQVQARGVVIAGLCLVLALPGCAEVPNAVNPVSWWHSMEGGEIARGRPPPPNDKQPFPRLTDAPQRPVGMPDWEWQQLSATLAAQRAQATSYAAANPIPVLPPSPAAAATPPAKVPAPPIPAAAIPGAGAAPPTTTTTTTLAGAPAAAPPAGSDSDTTASTMSFAGPTAKAKTNGPKTAPIPGATAAPFAPTNLPSIPGALHPVVQADEAALPTVPTTMPLPPSVQGFDVPQTPAPYVQPVPLPQPAPYVPPPPLPKVPPLAISFAPDSAVLTVPMQHALQLLVAGRGLAHIAVTGFGNAGPGAALADQAAAMPLALERARAIIVQLMADGMPPTFLAMDARGSGDGGLARLVD